MIYFELVRRDMDWSRRRASIRATACSVRTGILAKRSVRMLASRLKIAVYFPRDSARLTIAINLKFPGDAYGRPNVNLLFPSMHLKDPELKPKCRGTYFLRGIESLPMAIE